MNKPILQSEEEKDEREVIVMAQSPPLHLMLGISNHIMIKLTELSPFGVAIFEETLFVAKEPYHGKCYEGPIIDKMSDNLHILDSQIGQNRHGNDFIYCLKDYKDVVRAISGKVPLLDYQQKISVFRDTMFILHVRYGLTISTKIHIWLDHVEYHIFKTRKRLGATNDQSTESVHQIVNNRFQRRNYVVKDLDHPNHGKKLLNGIMPVNAYNL